ncbi:peptidase [Nocardioides sp. Soil797]|nr:peptidase [Nocardioides sp. Soil797]
MRFNPKARIDSGKVSDAGRGSGGGGLGGLGGGSRLPIPSGLGGGKIGLVVVVIFFLVAMCTGNVPGINQGDGSGGTQNNATGSDAQAQQEADAYDECQTGEDANNSEKCARQAILQMLETFWASQFPNGDFVAAPARTFQGSTTTGCGNATSAVGPFYCPADKTIYLDPTFFDDVLEGQLGGKGGDFVEPYVLGHEYGHHIQNITGQMRNVKTQQGADSDAVKLELQADCYAGLWTHHIESIKDSEGQQILTIDDADIKEAIDAAYTVGDDHIQEVTGGRVDANQWTHGSSEERMKWFRTGYESGDFDACNVW